MMEFKFKIIIMKTLLKILLLVAIMISMSKANTNEFKYYQFVVKSISIKGKVKQLKTLENSSNLLIAYIISKKMDTTGIYFFDISNVKSLKKIYFHEVSNPIDDPYCFEVTPNEKTLIIYEKNKCTIVDLTNKKYVTKDVISNVEIFKGRISVDGMHLFLLKNLRNKIKGYKFSLFRLKKKSIKLMKHIVGQKDNRNILELYPIKKNILITYTGNNFIAYDISNPLSPNLVYEIENYLGFPLFVDPKGYIFFSNIINSDIQKLVIAKVFPKIERKSFVSGKFDGNEILYFNKGKSCIIYEDLKTIYKLSYKNIDEPKIVEQYTFHKYPYSATMDRNYLYVGTEDQIYIIDPVKSVLNSTNLLNAYNQALKLYPKKEWNVVFGNTNKDKAINILKVAGIDQLLNTTPEDIPKEKLSIMVNNYGFFLTKNSLYKEACSFFQKAIELNKDNAEAYLNLGNSLKSLLSVSDSYKNKVILTKRIIRNYLQYKKLSKKSDRNVNEFLSFNIVKNPISNFCEYVATYSQKGRLRELFGSGVSIKRANGKGTMRSKIEPLANYDNLDLIDNISNQRINDGKEFPKGWEGPFYENLKIIPFIDGHYILYTKDYGRLLIASVPVGSSIKNGIGCTFKIHNKEKLKNKKFYIICNQFKKAEYINNNYDYYLSSEDLKKEYSWTKAIKCIYIDFNNDGKKEFLVKLQFASGAGTGCDYFFYDLLNNKKDGFGEIKERELLLRLQGIEYKDRNAKYFVPNCKGNETGWILHKGVTFYKTKSISKSGEQFNKVLYIKKGKIKKTCESDFKRQNNVYEEIYYN